jgi:hypothetical protein
MLLDSPQTPPRNASPLFDPRKYDPVSFSAAQARKPAPKSSSDYASISVSSYAHSVVRQISTLSSGMTVCHVPIPSTHSLSTGPI